MLSNDLNVAMISCLLKDYDLFYDLFMSDFMFVLTWHQGRMSDFRVFFFFCTKYGLDNLSDFSTENVCNVDPHSVENLLLLALLPSIFILSLNLLRIFFFTNTN